MGMSASSKSEWAERDGLLPTPRLDERDMMMMMNGGVANFEKKYYWFSRFRVDDDFVWNDAEEGGAFGCGVGGGGGGFVVTVVLL